MPNGFMGPKPEWDRREAPYIRIDPLLEAFARRNQLVVRRNYRDADRSLRFNDSLDRAIWVNSSDLYGESGAYDVSVGANQDRPDRYVQSKHVATAVPIENLERVLDHAATIVRSWSEADLVRAYPDDFGTFSHWLAGKVARLFGRGKR